MVKNDRNLKLLRDIGENLGKLRWEMIYRLHEIDGLNSKIVEFNKGTFSEKLSPYSTIGFQNQLTEVEDIVKKFEDIFEKVAIDPRALQYRELVGLDFYITKALMSVEVCRREITTTKLKELEKEIENGL